MSGVADRGIYAEFDPEPLSQHVRQLSGEDWLVLDANLEKRSLVAINPNAAGFAALTVSTAKAPRLRGIAGSLDLLFTNRREAPSLAGEDPERPMKAAVQALKGLNVGRAVISDGSDPVTVVENGRCHAIHVPPLESIVDVTGAEDAVAAATLHHLAGGDNMIHAICHGIAAAQAIVQVNGPW